MSPRTLKGLAIALGILACVWAGRHFLQSRGEARPRLWNKAQTATRLVISSPGGDPVSIEKQDGVWRLAAPFEYRASESKVEDFLKRLAGVRVSEPLSEREERHGLFGVSKSTGVRFTAYAEAEPGLDIWVGHSGATFDTFFFRREGERTVYEARGMARHRMVEKTASWADNVLMELDQTRIVSLRLVHGKKALTLNQREGTWDVDGVGVSTGAANTKIQPILTALTRLTTDEVKPAASVAAQAFANPELVLEVEHLGPEGKAVRDRLEFARQEKGSARHAVRKRGIDEVVFEVFGWRLDAFRIRRADLL